jgi:GrpB-like predicted nucleotidyltransferase (UPF0157 family)
MNHPEPAQIEIVAPRASWRSDFRALRDSLLLVAPSGSLLHHIGSTAVPGLDAKDVIDLQLTVSSLTDLDPARIEAAGFRHIPDRSDHAPPGLDVPDEGLAKRLFRSTGRRATLHVREAGQFNQRYALLCRDYLRTHPVAAAAYAQIKRRLARRFPNDDEAYYDIKDPVFDIIMDGANEWASATRWCFPPQTNFTPRQGRPAGMANTPRRRPTARRTFGQLPQFEDAIGAGNIGSFSASVENRSVLLRWRLCHAPPLGPGASRQLELATPATEIAPRKLLATRPAGTLSERAPSGSPSSADTHPIDDPAVGLS